MTLVFLLSLIARTMYAHNGQPLAPHDLSGALSFDPGVVIGLVLTVSLYAGGVSRLWRSAGGRRGIRVREAAAFGAGWLALVAALVSPLHHLGGVLFMAHMVQHELLMVVAAPLLILGRPLVAFLWAVPVSWRHRLGDWSAGTSVRATWDAVSRPAGAWTLHALAIWVWHVPRLYQATLASELIHGLQHLSFLGTALLFWWALLQRHDGRVGRPAAVVYLFTTAVHTTLLGALLTFSSRVWYPIYAAHTASWGLTPLEDQQLAGVIMWVPAGLAYLAAALVVAASWLKQGRSGIPVRYRLDAGTLMILLAALSLAGCRRSSALAAEEAARITGGDPARGSIAVRHYGCGACHTIPGIEGARGTVGPTLAGISGRSYIAGVLVNSPANLVRWIRHPQQVDSLTAMPEMGVSEADARDIASYLYTIR
jgi:putative membrane protein